MRWIIVFVLLFAIEFYAFQAIKTVCRNQMVYWGYAVISLAVFCYVMYTAMQYDRSVGPTRDTLRASAVFFLNLGPKMVLIAFVFFEDILRLFIGVLQYLQSIYQSQPITEFLPGRRKIISQLAIGAAAIPFFGLLYGIFEGRYRFKVWKHTLHFEDLPVAFDGFRLLQISDIHSGSLDDPKKIAYAMDLINAQAVDAIFFTGDLVNTHASEMDAWIPYFKKIKTPKHGKFSVLGNHDYGEYVSWETEAAKQANFKAIQDAHQQIDFKLLCNASAFIEKEGQRIAVIGVENWGKNFKKAGDLHRASQLCKDTDFKILLSHDPSHWEYEVKNHPNHYHLTLSGHTHGFQFGIEIPGFIQWSPVQYAYKQWAGMYQEFGRYLHVNRGFGYHAFPGRVGIWPELTVIELKRTQKNRGKEAPKFG